MDVKGKVLVKKWDQNVFRAKIFVYL